MKTLKHYIVSSMFELNFLKYLIFLVILLVFTQSTIAQVDPCTSCDIVLLQRNEFKFNSFTEFDREFHSLITSSRESINAKKSSGNYFAQIFDVGASGSYSNDRFASLLTAYRNEQYDSIHYEERVELITSMLPSDAVSAWLDCKLGCFSSINGGLTGKIIERNTVQGSDTTFILYLRFVPNGPESFTTLTSMTILGAQQIGNNLRNGTKINAVTQSFIFKRSKKQVVISLNFDRGAYSKVLPEIVKSDIELNGLRIECNNNISSPESIVGYYVRNLGQDRGRNNHGQISPKENWWPGVSFDLIKPGKLGPYRVGNEGQLYIDAGQDRYVHAYTCVYLSKPRVFQISNAEKYGNYDVAGIWLDDKDGLRGPFSWDAQISLKTGITKIHACGYNQNQGCDFGFSIPLKNYVDIINPDLDTYSTATPKLDLQTLLFTNGKNEIQKFNLIDDYSSGESIARNLIFSKPIQLNNLDEVKIKTIFNDAKSIYSLKEIKEFQLIGLSINGKDTIKYLLNGGQNLPIEQALLYKQQQIQLSESEIDFSKVSLDQEVTKFINIQNLLNIPITLNCITVSPFKIDQTIKLNPNEFKQISISMIPKSIGTVSDYIYINTNASTSKMSQVVRLSVKGTGILASNKAPVAVNDWITTKINRTTSINILNKCSDENGKVSICSFGSPINGYVSLSEGTFIYTPNKNYVGNDSFEYNIGDGYGAFSTGNISINVKPNNPPIQKKVLRDTTLAVDKAAKINLYDYFNDADGDPLNFRTSNSLSKIIAVSVIADSTLIITPLRIGETKLQLTTRDGIDSVSCSMNVIVVSKINSAPIAIGAIKDTTLNAKILEYDVSKYFFDIDADILNYTVKTQPSGILAISIDDKGKLICLPIQKGKTAISIIADDNKGGNKTITFTVTINSVYQDRAPIFSTGYPLVSSIKNDQTLSLNFPAIDPDGDLITYSLAINPIPTVLPVINSSGILTWTPSITDVKSTPYFLTISARSGIPLLTTNSNQVAITVTYDFLKGDANLDGYVDASDASCVLLHVVGKKLLLNKALISADVNSDGIVGAFDASLILYKIANGAFPLTKINAIKGMVKFGAFSFLNGSFNIPLNLTNSNGIQSASYEIRFDSYINFKGIKSFLPEGWISVSNYENNVLKIAISGSSQLAEGTIINILGELKNHEGVVSLNGYVKFNDETPINLEMIRIKEIPNEIKLNQNFPNPFNPTTAINYSLVKEARVNLTVYDLLGRIVRNLVDNYQESGCYSIKWDGTNNLGENVSSGIFICMLKAGEKTSSIKMILMK